MTGSPRSPGGHAPRPTAGLRVEVRRSKSGVVVVVRGDLERASVPTLAGCLAKLLGSVGSGETVVVDLAGVDFVDVGGTLLLLGATRRAAERGSTLHLAGCNALLLRVLQLTGNLDAVNVVAARQVGPDGPGGTGGTAHPDTASSNGAPAHRVDPASATGSPRSRGAPRSIRQSHGGHR